MFKDRQCPNCQKKGLHGLRSVIASHDFPAICRECDQKFIKYYPATFATMVICLILYKFFTVPAVMLWMSPPLTAIVENKFGKWEVVPDKLPKVSIALKVIAFLVVGATLMRVLDHI